MTRYVLVAPDGAERGGQYTDRVEAITVAVMIGYSVVKRDYDVRAEEVIWTPDAIDCRPIEVRRG